MTSLNCHCEDDYTLKLVKKIRAGDVSALDELLELYIPQVKAFFRHLRVPEIYIEDLVQETFERMFSKLHTFDENKRFYSWLMVIGKNLYIDKYRKEEKANEILAAEPILTSCEMSDPEGETIGKVSAEELLKTLDNSERYIIELRVFKRLSFGEIAEITGIQEVTLRSRFFRAIKKLKNISQ